MKMIQLASSSPHPRFLRFCHFFCFSLCTGIGGYGLNDQTKQCVSVSIDEEELEWGELTEERRMYCTSKGCTHENWDDEDADADWEDLSVDDQKKFMSLGWNAEAWNKENSSLMTFYNEKELEWNDLPNDRLQYWIERGYDEVKWNSGESSFHSELYARGDKDGVPIVINLTIGELSAYNLTYFESFKEKEDTVVQVRGGDSLMSDETPVKSLSLAEFLQHFREGGAKYKLQIEDLDLEKATFDVLGKAIKNCIKGELLKSELGGSNGAFKQEWHDLDNHQFDWALFMGANGTSTPMHYDSDRFNFLYVVEGKKKVVVIPNDKRTENMFEVMQFYSGSAYTGIDVFDDGFDLPEGSMLLDVNAGEGISIPYRWWHAVRNVDATLAYSFRIVDDM
uniref:JmjC domain-containing protein n=1 Tax=Leptocylindrus danicus TaxID=163516 RepID=A0A7S2LGM3_9STRA